ncbi:MAG TPA: undecaprenyl-phosphate glucose phosphotransferase [Patescibacteria group bacterium]|jgi:exopolysaccharide biosynthesis polyprenyl glycosylphosphotransferase|nr:undecaprenyl-phosphate glucose phosphotransferase [Patescibacteria group bacterium]
MPSQRVRPIYSITLVILDALMIMVAFTVAYRLRIMIPWPAELADATPLARYSGLIAAQIVGVITAMFFFKLYYLPRAVSRVDQLYSVLAAVTIGTLMAIAFSVLVYKNSVFEVDYPRAMVIYAWILSIIFITIGRTGHQYVRDRLRDRGFGKDRLIVVGSGEVARIIIQRILWSPKLGYELVGVVFGEGSDEELIGVPVLGKPEDLPDLINDYSIDEVIIAMPEDGHREVLRVISYCERGRVSIKVFPDFFQFIASETDIDDLGGLPLLSMRDYAMRGYLLIFKRAMDILGAIAGLIFFSPLMMLASIAIKLESPGPVFFVQERMGLDGKPFLMVKFRSMRADAEKHGPGWTTANDPRRTRLGSFLRKIEIDELPQFINVFLGEMSLVGPRPEQTYYVNLFRESVPRYMERHREKAGMTGWAQVNGMRGDTSIIERTRFDIWYTENWSVLLDIKIIVRTFWQIVSGNNQKPI